MQRFSELIKRAGTPSVNVCLTEGNQGIHKAQLLTYMKVLDVPLGLLINFHEIKLTEGLARMILPGANRAGI